MIDLPPPPSYEQTIQAVVQCGIPPDNIRVEYIDEFQSDMVYISDLGEVSESKLKCLKSAVHPFYTLEIEKEEQRAAFYEFSWREDRPKEKADATQWLLSKDFLHLLPAFDPQQDLDRFIEALETACGLNSGGALMVWSASEVAVRPDFIQGTDFDALTEKLACLRNMFVASDAEEHGVHFVFIGNAQPAKEEQK
ncbi:hypothetical protein [Sphingopyxis sp. 550A]